MAAGTSASAPPDLRREQMLRAAAELIGERGFSETRIADVARRAGASPALVIYYFGTKDQLLTEALRFSEDGVLRRTVTAELGDAAHRARAAGAAGPRSPASRRAKARSPGAWGLWFDLWAQAFRHPEIAKDRIELDQRWRDTIAAGRARRPGQRARSAAVDADAFAITFSALLDGLSIQVALRGPGRRPGPGVRDRDGLRGPRAGRRLAAAAGAPRPRLRSVPPPLTTARGQRLRLRRRRPAGRRLVGEQPGRLRREGGAHRAARDERRRHRLADVGHRDQQGLPVRQPDDDVGGRAEVDDPVHQPVEGVVPRRRGAGRSVAVSVMRSGRTITLPGPRAGGPDRASAGARRAGRSTGSPSAASSTATSSTLADPRKPATYAVRGARTPPRVRPTCSTRPSRITASRSDIVSASSWSWVT